VSRVSASSMSRCLVMTPQAAPLISKHSTLMIDRFIRASHIHPGTAGLLFLISSSLFRSCSSPDTLTCTFASIIVVVRRPNILDPRYGYTDRVKWKKSLGILEHLRDICLLKFHISMPSYSAEFIVSCYFEELGAQ
jgi:hypothetical protein